MKIWMVTLGGFFFVTLVGLLVFGCFVSAQPKNDARPTREALLADAGDRRCANQVRVNSPLELRTTLASSFVGCIVIPKDVQWHMEDPCGNRNEFGSCMRSAMAPLTIRPGVSLIGERGLIGSRPTLFTNYKTHNWVGYCLFETPGNDVRIEGLHVKGPANGSRSSEQPYVSAICITRDAAQKSGVTTIADNEFDEWSGSGVSVRSTPGERSEAEYPEGASHFRREDAGLVRIARNYIHHHSCPNCVVSG